MGVKKAIPCITLLHQLCFAGIYLCSRFKRYVTCFIVSFGLLLSFNKIPHKFSITSLVPGSATVVR